MRPKRRLTREQRRAVEKLVSDPDGTTEGLLVLLHGFETTVRYPQASFIGLPQKQ